MEATRIIGRNERNFLFSVVESALPRLAVLGRDHFVGRTDDVAYWTDSLRKLLELEWRAEEEIAKKARQVDARRDIPAWQTFKRANSLKAILDRFDRELAEAQKADEDKRKEREAAGQPAAQTGTDS